MSTIYQQQSSTNSLSESLITELTIGAVILTFLLFICALFSCLNAKGYWGANPAFWRERPAFNSQQNSNHALTQGLDISSIKALCSFTYNPQDFTEPQECSVCLSELIVGDEARLLPLCRHGFHVECIDMWFQSHSNCPLCRTPVKNCGEFSDHSVVSVVGDLSSGSAGIDEGGLSSSIGDPVEEVGVGQVSGPTTRLQSLRRFLRGVVGSSCGPSLTSGSDVELGVRSVPKISMLACASTIH